MNVFNNVSSQVTGLGSSLGSWFKKEGKEGEELEQPAEEVTKSAEEVTTTEAPQEEVSPANISNKSVKGSADEDNTSQNSGETESMDSHHTTPEDENKAGFASVSMADLELKAAEVWQGLASSFNFGGVSSRASASAKSVGSFFSSALTKIKETVEKNPLLAEFNREQDAFLKAKGAKAGQAVPPWVGYPQEESLKEEIMALSSDRRNFVRSPPSGVSFEFDLEQFSLVAEATLQADQNLEKMRFDLVPKVVSEEAFWRNYFYRVGLIRQSEELASIEKEESKTKEEGQEEKQQKGDEDWEAELREELGEAVLTEYEVVGGEKDLEKELQSMIDEEPTTDLC